MSVSDVRRAYSLLTLKAVDDDQRIITGIATTPTPDRADDIVEPKGAEFNLPIPLLWQHNAAEPIGEVFAARVTSDGIEVKARIAKIDEPGRLKDRLDEAWQSIKARLVRGLSIGFSPIESARIEGTYGFRYLKWLWLELSAVTIPANAEASIQTIKSYDTHRPALSGGSRAGSSNPPAVAGRVKANTSMNLSEKITSKQNDFKAKSARLQELNDLDTLTTEQRIERDTIAGDVEELASDLKALKAQELAQAATAAPVVVKAPALGSAVQNVQQVGSTTKLPDLPKGIGFARYVICKTAGQLLGVSPIEVAKERYPDDPRIAGLIKGAVAGGSTLSGGSNWGSDLVDAQTLVSEFIDYLRPMTILGKFGTGNVPSLRRVPFNVRIVGQNAAMTGYWVGQQKHKPVTKAGYTPVTLTWAKVASIAVISDELARFSNPSAEALVRDELARALRERLDIDFIDPDKALDANVSPASIINGVSPVSGPSGTDAEAVRTDLNNLISTFIANNISLTSGVFIMPNTIALALSLMRNGLGQKEFPDITMNGGTLEGFPVITSEYATFDSPLDNVLILVAADEIFLSDDGQVSVDMSREASIKMAEDPEGGDTGVAYTSMWQTNQIALRAERYINWATRRTGAAQYIAGVQYSPASGS